MRSQFKNVSAYQRINVSTQQQGILSPAPLGRGFAPMDVGADRANLFVDPPILVEEGLRVLGVRARFIKSYL
ncbi:hypothetical protein COY52_07415 [Candidatus Desantisbacteria bacterium CG_4_10_14_0_8_um_filter_48_22]|uniref:Uncharacterized protein n=1 Tax=Candidatus Desantisbacteria bacterium CG_4_10_14_0_8_um_filter_48_22 TaxID=1974543 RepID=A0A2M7SA48_9BACT|nr:MAG: hypothetical protein AUJ67_05295 [Candidatus Desantisbacteria bacterium CG1_02_49_89]PIV56384.1 MAG: hypothetical protein COS16_04130 [Candidatus Desantisbacteria bacterium CG02_land_8_20_14_3_00_49_13]PIZ16318.1 MAG: hypothetical protein COY52_07415 [Candidatus Desantisbacteria bacterium CG_4_10_14_0_8_um_filter_48_22]